MSLDLLMHSYACHQDEASSTGRDTRDTYRYRCSSKDKNERHGLFTNRNTWKEMQGPGRSLLVRGVRCTLLQLDEVFYQSVDQLILPFSLYKA